MDQDTNISNVSSGGDGNDSASGGTHDDSSRYYAPYTYESITEAVTRRRPLVKRNSSSTSAVVNNKRTTASSGNAVNLQLPISNSATISSHSDGGGNMTSSTKPNVSTTSSASLVEDTFRSKSQLQQQQSRQSSSSSASSSSQAALKRSLSLPDLIFYGVGCSVGAGIYSLVGIGGRLAGPAVAVSFAMCGIACCFTSFGYAEFASRVPLAGSAYTFTYVSFGELAGWLVGWNLTLGYAVSAAVVARSWASYVVEFLMGILLHNNNMTTSTTSDKYSIQEEEETSSAFYRFLHWSIHAPVPLLNIFGKATSHDGDNNVEYTDYNCCPLSMVIIGICTFILVTGAKESSRFNTAMTILNLSVLGFVVLSGILTGNVHASDNLVPFFPQGMAGVGRAAGLVFFSYLGFDMVSCLAEEVSEPERNLPIGIIGSLGASMAIYVTVSIVVIAMAPVSILGDDTPIVNALLSNGCCTNDQMQNATITDHEQQCLSYSCTPVLNIVLYTGSRLVSCGAMFGLTTATFSCLMGQPRIFYSMAVDGLFFKVYSKVSPRTGVPTIGTILTGIVTALVACFIDLESLANVISLGTLQVFTFVNAGIIILRMTPPVTDQDDLDDDHEKLLLEAASLAGSFSHSAPHERSPLVRNPEAAAVARSLGLIKKSSREIRSDLQHEMASLLSLSSSSPIVAPSDHHSKATTKEESAQIDSRNSHVLERVLLKRNGAWPHWLTLSFTLLSIAGSIGLNHGWNIWILSSIAMFMMGVTISLSRLSQAKPPESVFSCPLVPYVPLLGIFCNGYMMGSMPISTWCAIFAWLLIGLLFWLLYGMQYSKLRMANKKQNAGEASRKPTKV